MSHTISLAKNGKFPGSVRLGADLSDRRVKHGTQAGPSAKDIWDNCPITISFVSQPSKPEPSSKREIIKPVRVREKLSKTFLTRALASQIELESQKQDVENEPPAMDTHELCVGRSVEPLSESVMVNATENLVVNSDRQEIIKTHDLHVEGVAISSDNRSPEDFPASENISTTDQSEGRADAHEELKVPLADKDMNAFDSVESITPSESESDNTESQDDGQDSSVKTPKLNKKRRANANRVPKPPKIVKYGCRKSVSIKLDKANLSQKHIDWVEPIFKEYLTIADESASQDFISDGPTPKKRKAHKDPYVVDKILAMIMDPAGDDLFYIRWFGYSDRTWEPFANLDNCPGKLAEFRRELKQLSKYEEQRSLCREKTKEFLDKINEPWPNHDSGIEVRNDVDLTWPMMTFNYIINLKMPADKENVTISCECVDGICDEKCACATQEGFKMPYNQDGILINRSQNYPVYECNDNCPCDPEKCQFRVVQKGRKVKMQIFKTSNGRGWGVKALEHIKKNQFVVEYIGEVVSYQEANERGKQYDARGRTYLFDMDLFEIEGQDESQKFTIDAKPYGNEARFINHACHPNLFTRAVWWESADPSIHHLALFAKRDIKIGDELSFSYNNSSLSKESDEVKREKNEGQVKCQCRKNCPNKLFK